MANKLPKSKAIANLIINKILPLTEENGKTINHFIPFTDNLIQLIQKIEDQSVSQSVAYQKLFPKLLEDGKVGVDALIENLGLKQSGDVDSIDSLILSSFEKFPDKAKALKAGKHNLLGLFMGEIMRNSKGQVNPKIAKDRILAVLSTWD